MLLNTPLTTLLFLLIIPSPSLIEARFGLFETSKDLIDINAPQSIISDCKLSKSEMTRLFCNLHPNLFPIIIEVTLQKS